MYYGNGVLELTNIRTHPAPCQSWSAYPPLFRGQCDRKPFWCL